MKISNNVKLYTSWQCNEVRVSDLILLIWNHKIMMTMEVLLLCLHLCLSVEFNSLSCSFTSMCLSNAFLDDMSVRDGRRVKSSFTSRLYKSFRDRYTVKSKLNKSFHDMAAKRQFETSFLDSTVLFNSTVADPHDISVLRSHRASWHHYRFNKSSHQSSTESRV
jgi:hypothetical protein